MINYTVKNGWLNSLKNDASFFQATFYAFSHEILSKIN